MNSRDRDQITKRLLLEITAEYDRTKGRFRQLFFDHPFISQLKNFTRDLPESGVALSTAQLNRLQTIMAAFRSELSSDEAKESKSSIAYREITSYFDGRINQIINSGKHSDIRFTKLLNHYACKSPARIKLSSAGCGTAYEYDVIDLIELFSKHGILNIEMFDNIISCENLDDGLRIILHLDRLKKASVTKAWTLDVEKFKRLCTDENINLLILYKGIFDDDYSNEFMRSTLDVQFLLDFPEIIEDMVNVAKKSPPGLYTGPMIPNIHRFTRFELSNEDPDRSSAREVAASNIGTLKNPFNSLRESDFITSHLLHDVYMLWKKNILTNETYALVKKHPIMRDILIELKQKDIDPAICLQIKTPNRIRNAIAMRQLTKEETIALIARQHAEEEIIMKTRVLSQWRSVTLFNGQNIGLPTEVIAKIISADSPNGSSPKDVETLVIQHAHTRPNVIRK